MKKIIRILIAVLIIGIIINHYNKNIFDYIEKQFIPENGKKEFQVYKDISSNLDKKITKLSDSLVKENELKNKK